MKSHKKYLLFVTIVLLNFQITSAQSFKSAIELNAGPSGYGTGDLLGLFVDFSHINRFTKYLGLVAGLSSTMHYRSELPYNPYDRNPDYYTTAGLQLSACLRFSFDLARAHELHIFAGPMVRFQANSLPEISTVIIDPYATDISRKYRFEFHPQTSLTPGYLFAVGYTATIKSKVRLGGKLYFQNDTRGDVITGITPSIGYILR